jgi:type I restriction enzyme S subunit
MEYVKLSTLTLSAITGLDAIKRAPIIDEDTGLKCIRIQDISQNKDFLNWGNTKVSLSDYKKTKLLKNDILVARTGATVGVSYYVKDNLESVFNNGTIRLRLDTKKISPYLVYCIFQTKEFRQYIDNISCVATQPNLRISGLLRYFIPVFDEKSQMKISLIINNYDQLIENNNKRIKLLEDMAESLYKEWFVRFRFPGYENMEFEKEIPKGWVYKNFSDIWKFSRGVSYSTEEIECEEGENLINLKNIASYGGFRRDGTKLYAGKYKDEQVVKFKDLIMGITDMTQDRRTVGAVALIPNIRGIISADLIKLESEIDNVFSYCLFKHGFYSKLISQFGNGANVIHLKPTSIKNQKILIPNEIIINKFAALINPTIDEIEKLNSENDLLIKQRDSLLPRLMSGKLEVRN